MKVDIATYLFASPEIELDDYKLTAAGLREFATDLSERLDTVADVVEKLKTDGWNVEVVGSNLQATHPEVRNYADAVERVRRLQIEEDVVDIAEWSDKGERLTPG